MCFTSDRILMSKSNSKNPSTTAEMLGKRTRILTERALAVATEKNPPKHKKTPQPSTDNTLNNVPEPAEKPPLTAANLVPPHVKPNRRAHVEDVPKDDAETSSSDTSDASIVEVDVHGGHKKAKAPKDESPEEELSKRGIPE